MDSPNLTGITSSSNKHTKSFVLFHFTSLIYWITAISLRIFDLFNNSCTPGVSVANLSFEIFILVGDTALLVGDELLVGLGEVARLVGEFPLLVGDAGLGDAVLLTVGGFFTASLDGSLL